jgi:hypothetical protein
MDAYDRCTNLGNNLACSVAIYGQGREIFRPPTYSKPYEDGHPFKWATLSQLKTLLWNGQNLMTLHMEITTQVGHLYILNTGHGTKLSVMFYT